MGYEAEYTHLFLKLLKKLDGEIQVRILKAIEEILQYSSQGSKLIYADRDLWKWRVGDYRIIYEINESKRLVIFVIVDHRKRVYKRRFG